MTLLCGLKSQIAFVQTNGFFHEIVVTIFHNMFIFCLPVFFLFCCFTFLHKRKEPLNIYLGRISDLKLNTILGISTFQPMLSPPSSSQARRFPRPMGGLLTGSPDA